MMMIQNNNYKNTDVNRTFTRKEINNYVNQSNSVKEIRELVDFFTTEGLITTASGHLDKSNLTEQVKYQFTVHNMRIWEYGRVYDVLRLKPKMKVLDCGGASSPLVFYCAKKGVEITTIDLQDKLIQNTKYVAKQLGWNIKAYVQDMTQMAFADNYFDAIFSISVLEHMSHDLKAKALGEFRRVLKPGGMAGITFDYGKSINAKTSYDYQKHEQFHTPIRNIMEIKKYIIEPSGMEIYGNQKFHPVIESDKNFIKKCWLKNTIKGYSYADIIKRAYVYSPFFRSPYFKYTFFSIFLSKPKYSL